MNNKYYTQAQLDAIFEFEHKRTAEPTNETKYKDVRKHKDVFNNECGEDVTYTNFNEFQKIGGNKSFMFLVNEEHREMVKQYWDLLNQTDGDTFIALKELAKKLDENEYNAFIFTYSNKIHEAFTEHATDGKHNNIGKYTKDNMDIHNKLVKHYMETGEILDINNIEDTNTSVSNETSIPASNTVDGTSTDELVQTNEENVPKNEPKPLTESEEKASSSETNDTPESEVINDVSADEPVKSTAEPKDNKLPTKTLTQNSKEAVEKGASKIKIGKKGMAAIAVTALALGIALKDDNKKPKNVSRTSTNDTYDDSHAQQMAADISSYRYGKHMTGFVNF